MNRTLTLTLVLVAVAAIAAASVGLPGSPLSPLPPPGEQDQPSDDENGVVGPTETVWDSTAVSFGYTEPTYLVIQTQEEWEALWASTGRDPPTVDFVAHTVLGAIYGHAPTGGYDIKIEEIVASSKGGAAVGVTITKPGTNCNVLQVINYPAHFVSIPKTAGPFDFTTETRVLSCE